MFEKGNTLKELKTYNLNFGPQNPSGHGVLRLIFPLVVNVVEVEQITTVIELTGEASQWGW